MSIPNSALFVEQASKQSSQQTATTHWEVPISILSPELVFSFLLHPKMPRLHSTLALLTTILFTLLSLGTADFLISNTTTCLHLSSCHHGAQILTSTSPSTYTCSYLHPAQDQHHIANGTLGPLGDDFVFANSAPCGDNERLHFVRHSDDADYEVLDNGGNHMGDCVEDESLSENCDVVVGWYSFRSMYRCSTSICG